jgi:hypothetical protein
MFRKWPLHFAYGLLFYRETDLWSRRRTFTKKISEWGLKKNYSKKEREEILKSKKNIGQFNSDRRVTKAKIQRWQKQFGRYEIDTRTTCISVYTGYAGS